MNRTGSLGAIGGIGSIVGIGAIGGIEYLSGPYLEGEGCTPTTNDFL